MDEPVGWTMLNFSKGDFVEVPLKETSWEPMSEAWAGFLVMDRQVTADGGVALRVHSVGSTDSTQSRTLSGRFNRKEGFLHLCISRPCTEAEENYLHVTRLKVFTHAGFAPAYYTAAHRRQVAKWLGVGEEPHGEEDLEVPEEGVAEGKRGPEARSLSKERRVGWSDEGEEGAGREGAKAAPKRRGSRPPALRTGPAALARARGKGQAAGEEPGGRKELKSLESRSQPKLRGGDQEEQRELAHDLRLGTSEEREQMSTEELRKRLDQVRLRLGGAARPSISDLRRLGEEDGQEVQELEDCGDSDYVEEPKSLSSGSTLRKKRRLEDTKDTTTRDVSKQLIQQAQQLAGERGATEVGATKKSADGGPKKGEREVILALLNQFSGQKSSGSGGGRDPPKEDRGRSRSKRKKKKKKKRGRRNGKRRRLVNGVLISSDGTGSSSPGSGSESYSTEEQFEAPLRRRSKKQPWIRASSPSPESTGGAGPGQPCGSRQARRTVDHRGGEDMHLLQPSCETPLQPPARSHERPLVNGPGDRLDQSWGYRAIGRHAGGPFPCSPSSPCGSVLGTGQIPRGRHPRGTVSHLSSNLVGSKKTCESQLEGGDPGRLGTKRSLAAQLVRRRQRKFAKRQRQRKRKERKQTEGERRVARKRRQGEIEVEGDARQGRKRREMRGVRATVKPPEEGGEALKFEEKDRGVAGLMPLGTPEKGYSGAEEASARHELQGEEFRTGQEICLSVGRRIRNLQNAGTLLAWLMLKAMTQEVEGAWQWLSRVIFDQPRTATGYVGPGRAATFPLRRGDLEEVFQELCQATLELASSEDFSNRWAEDAWVLLALHSTNGLAGPVRPLAKGGWTTLERRAADTARCFVQRLLKCTGGSLTPFEKIGEDLAAARVDYNGEETGVCETLTWAQMVPALPPVGHGGSIQLTSLVSEATKEILENPQSLMKDDFSSPIPKIPGSVHFGRGEKAKVCEELVSRGICEWIPTLEVIEVKGVRILNGLFGVKKPAKLADGRPVLRVIMNLKATNSVMRQIRGAVDGLPAITAWQAGILENQESFHFYQSDISSAFYLFALPRQWLPFLCFDVHCKGEQIGRCPGTNYTLACGVLPMGMHSSVTLMQEVSETILWREGLSRSSQVRRGQPVPAALMKAATQSVREDKYFWQVYLDNFMGGDRRAPGESSKVGDQVHEVCETTWKNHGILSAEKKKVCDTMETEELGALLHGEIGIVGASPQRFCKLVQSTLWLLGQRPITKKMVQVVAGRWVHVLQFRRPGMSFLDKTWSFINMTGQKDLLALQTKREFFLLMGAIPLLHTFLGAEVGDTIWCSDASEKGGAVGCSKDLTAEGKDFVLSSRISGREVGTAPVLVIGLFSGIGGTFRVYDLLDVVPRGMIAVDVHTPANRIVSRRWPMAEILRDVRAITREVVKSWADNFHTVDEIHLWGGFPCRDLSSARANRRNLEGSESGLFFEFLRIWELLQEEFSSRVVIKVAAENVASMDESASSEISSWMGRKPYFLDSVQAVPLRRPRLCWTSEKVEGCLEGVQVVEERRWHRVVATAAYPSTDQWISRGFHWPGEQEAKAFPTCMRAVLKDRPPPQPAGLDRADADCRARWSLCGFIYPPYQFRSEFLLWKGEQWRLTDSNERGLLMGYGHGHCDLAWPASKIKDDPHGYEREKCSLVGDAFSMYSFCVIGAALCRNFCPRAHYAHLTRRMGLAPGFRASFRLQAPLAPRLQYGCQTFAETQEGIGVRDLNLMLLARTNFTGSDVRVVTGQLTNPRAFPRQSISAAWWSWQHTFKVRWPKPQHINQLELKALMLSIFRGIRTGRWSQQRIVHLSDSYVTISVVSKGRSSSVMLNRLLKVLNAHLLIHGIYLVLAHVESTENPTDGQSRC